MLKVLIKFCFVITCILPDKKLIFCLNFSSNYFTKNLWKLFQLTSNILTMNLGINRLSASRIEQNASLPTNIDVRLIGYAHKDKRQADAWGLELPLQPYYSRSD